MLVRNFDAWEVAIGIKASAAFRYDNLQAEGRFRPQAAAAPTRFLVRPHKIHTITMNEFFQNVSRYASYFVTVMLGIFFFTFGWLKPLLQKPATAIALVGFLVAGFFFISFTLRAMLGLA
jgi:hypothetical protein